MTPSLLFDLDGIDLDSILYDVAAIERVNPHRGNMRLLDGIVWAKPEAGNAVAYHDVRSDAFWVEGHIPGRPLMPGVLMIEVAAQTASFYSLLILETAEFMGFVAANDIKFRGQVEPGNRLYILAHLIELRRRRSICKCQGLVDGRIVFEGTITGMPM